eukprot:scaffold5.g981.t1
MGRARRLHASPSKSPGPRLAHSSCDDGAGGHAERPDARPPRRWPRRSRLLTAAVAAACVAAWLLATRPAAERRWLAPASAPPLAQPLPFSEAAARVVDEGEQSINLTDAVYAFGNFSAARRPALRAFWAERLAASGVANRGIVMSAGSPTTLTNAFVNLYVLRHRLGCRLPATVMFWGWHLPDVPKAATVRFMQRHIANLSFVDASVLPWPPWHSPLEGRNGTAFHGWKVKAFAIYSAPYRNVLYLDSDALPVFDPEALFGLPAYQQHGALFWPDIWCGDAALFTHLGMPSIGMERQTESGVIYLNRRRHWLALEWALWLNVNNRWVYKLAYGDKDTFRAAFHLAGSSSNFHQVAHPLALTLEKAQAGFRTRGFLQAHPNGIPMVIHRVEGKFDPESDDLKPMTHVTVPSCRYFLQACAPGFESELVHSSRVFEFGVQRPAPGEGRRGWNRDVINASHFAPAVFSARPAARLREGVAPCDYTLRALYGPGGAVARCGRYDYTTAGGAQALPVFEIAPDSRIGAALAAAEEAFLLLRAARRAAPELFASSYVPPTPAPAPALQREIGRF